MYKSRVSKPLFNSIFGIKNVALSVENATDIQTAGFDYLVDIVDYNFMMRQHLYFVVTFEIFVLMYVVAVLRRRQKRGGYKQLLKRKFYLKK